MPILKSFLRHEMPRDLATQIRSYVRMQWPFLNSNDKAIWNFAPQPNPSLHFVLIDNELLLSHAVVNQRDLTHRGKSWRVYGLSTVFTYPDRRGQGLASQVVAAGTEFILKSDADLAILFCGERLENFYARHGWHAAPKARILFGDPGSPQHKTDNLIMMLLVSPTAKQSRAQFEAEDFYVGASTW